MFSLRREYIYGKTLLLFQIKLATLKITQIMQFFTYLLINCYYIKLCESKLYQMCTFYSKKKKVFSFLIKS